MARNKPLNKQQAKPRERDPQVAGLEVPLHPIETGQSVLGGLMLDNERWNDVAERVAADDFYTRPHCHILTETMHLQGSGSPVDLITPAESLKRQGQLNSASGFAYLIELSRNTPSAAGISAYADIAREHAVIREMTSVANEIVEAGFNSQGHTSEDLLNLTESHVFKVAESRVNKDEGPKNIADVLDTTVVRIKQLLQQPHDGVTGVSTGYDGPNKKIVSLQSSDLTIIAACPSMGRITSTMNPVENAAMLQDKPVLVFPLEMPSEQIMICSLASPSRVDQTKVRTGQLDDEDQVRIPDTMDILLEKRNTYIDNSPGLTLTEVRSRTRCIAREHGDIGFIMIDYPQLMYIPVLPDSHTLETAEVSRSLKTLAKELNVPMVALSQLNRSLEQRADKCPVNSDLCEPNSIEQDADSTMFIYRDEMYHENSDLKSITEVITGKQRNGPIGTVRLTFNDQ